MADTNGTGIPEGFSPLGFERGIGTLAEKSPAQVEEHLQSLGYRAHPEARAAIAGLVHRHELRLRRQFLERLPVSRQGRRESLFLGGPSSCGKTHLLQLLRDDLLDVPAVIVDAADLCECRDVDHVVSRLLSRLIDVAGGSTIWARCGVLCIDNLERVPCTATGDEGEAGLEWLKRHWRVQQAILKLISADHVDYNYQRGSGNCGPTRTFTLEHLSVVVAGAFGNPGAGVLPSLLSAFKATVHLEPLRHEELTELLHRLIDGHRRWEQDGAGFTPPAEEVSRMADEAIREGTGCDGAYFAFIDSWERFRSRNPQEKGGNG